MNAIRIDNLPRRQPWVTIGDREMDMVEMGEDLRRCNEIFDEIVFFCSESETFTREGFLKTVENDARKGIEITKKYKALKRERPDWNAIPEGLESIE